MKPSPTPQPLASLLSKLADGVLDEADKAKLEEILRKTPTARAYYRTYLATHLELTEAAPHLNFALAAHTSWFHRARIPLAIAALIPFVLALALWSPWRDSHQPPTGQMLAVTTVTQNVRWSLTQSPAVGLELHAGRIKLTAGTLAFAFSGNQIVTLAAPTDFELTDENEILLHQGSASLRIVGDGLPCIIRVPHGAVVDLGTEFSVKVGPDGNADVWVFEGKALASLTSGVSTREEKSLAAGQSLRIGKTFSSSPATAADFIRPLPGTGIPDSPAGTAYAAALTTSRPTAWWRFEQDASARQIPNETGGQPLNLHGSPKIAGDKQGRRYLHTDAGKHSGFAMPTSGIDGLDTTRGFTIELLFHSTSEKYSSLIALELYGVDYSEAALENGNLHHAPARAMIERMARKGAHIRHVHPDFALRGMLRSQVELNYLSGTNIYSAEAHLLHRWIHVAMTHDNHYLRIYIDGALSSEVPAREAPRGDSLRPVIARMQPDPRNEKRQWNGGIDEVALYDRVLGPEEIQAHAAALDP